MDEQMRFNHIGPHFAVRDVPRAMSFYQAVLGFGVDYIAGDPPQYVVVFRDEVYLHLSLSDDPAFQPGSGRAFVAVKGVDQLWEKVLTVSEESVCESLDERDYGHGARFRGFAVKDPDGNILRIGEPV